MQAFTNIKTKFKSNFSLIDKKSDSGLYAF